MSEQTERAQIALDAYRGCRGVDPDAAYGDLLADLVFLGVVRALGDDRSMDRYEALERVHEQMETACRNAEAEVEEAKW